MQQKQIPFTQHAIDNPHIFAQHDSYFVCSYKILNKVKIQLEDTFLVDENGLLYKIKPKHWIISLMDRHIVNPKQVDKFLVGDVGYFKFDYYFGAKIMFIEKPKDKEFITNKVRKNKKKVVEVIEDGFDEDPNGVCDFDEIPKDTSRKYTKYENEV